MWGVETFSVQRNKRSDVRFFLPSPSVTTSVVSICGLDTLEPDPTWTHLHRGSLLDSVSLKENILRLHSPTLWRETSNHYRRVQFRTQNPPSSRSIHSSSSLTSPLSPPSPFLCTNLIGVKEWKSQEGVIRREPEVYGDAIVNLDTRET